MFFVPLQHSFLLSTKPISWKNTSTKQVSVKALKSTRSLTSFSFSLSLQKLIRQKKTKKTNRQLVTLPRNSSEKTSFPLIHSTQDSLTSEINSNSLLLNRSCSLESSNFPRWIIWLIKAASVTFASMSFVSGFWKRNLILLLPSSEDPFSWENLYRHSTTYRGQYVSLNYSASLYVAGVHSGAVCREIKHSEGRAMVRWCRATVKTPERILFQQR